MLRRGLALGGGLIVLILIVLGVKGCLDARANRELSDYARNVSQIVDETEQTSKAFFGKLEDPGDLTVTDFVNEVNADRSAMDNYASRIDGLGAPGDMGSAQSKLELVYELRAAAMGEIADKMSTALGDAGAEKATAAIANQMQKLFASDVVYETVVRPEIDGVLADNGITDSDVPKSSFIPDDDTSWLEESTVADALAALGGGGGGAAAPGSHGLGLGAVSANGTELVQEGEAVVAAEETVEVEVQVENQGESTENGITVSVSVDGANELQQDISAISAGEVSTVTIPLTPTPSGTVALEVKVDTVPGEQISENNEATYTVTFE
ncbi:MAG TPA: CARDB domain-containing protein [Solirubrobacterales bacterium]